MEITAPIVVMGVSGAGKTTIGRALADAAGVPFVDADDLHSAEAKAQMAAGTALGDDDRAPWLDRVGQAAASAERGVVIACSALRRRYRDRLRLWVPNVSFVHLHLDVPALRVRLDSRDHEYMAPSLLQSQMETLEPLADDEGGITLSAAATVTDIIASFHPTERSSHERHSVEHL